MPLDELIDAVVAALVVTLLSARRRCAGTSRAPRRPAPAKRRDTARPRRTAPARPAGIAAGLANPATPVSPVSPVSPVALAGPATFAASADDFGATVIWRYPEGVRPVVAFDPEAFPPGIPSLENTGEDDSSPGSPAGRNRPPTTTRPAGHP